jgi:hypothetical protein
MPTLEFYRRKEKSIVFIHELMDLLRQNPKFEDRNLKPQGHFMPSFRIGNREYNIVNKIDHVIIRPKHWYHDDGSYTVSPPPARTFNSVESALEYLTSHC